MRPLLARVAATLALAAALAACGTGLSVPGFATDMGAPRVGPNGEVKPDVASRYRLDLTCGVEWLGTLNGVAWRARADTALGVPAAWAAAAEPDGTVDLTILLTMDPAPMIEAAASGTTITYLPSGRDLPACP